MRQILITLFSLIVAIAGVARTLSPEEALSRTTDFQHGSRSAASESKTPTLVYRQNVPTTNAPAVYIFNNADNQGFMVLSADDAATPVLGYSDSGNFDPENMPDNFKWWIEEYARQIEWAEQHPSTGQNTKVSRAADYDPIAPQCLTTWSQRGAYNKYVPLEDGEDCATGCVATAMAQVMKYHNWPQRGFGEHSYTWKGQTLSMDFGETTFDWENMIPVYYYEEYTEAQADAVATLMKACGISVNMNYGADASSAQSNTIATALYKYFKYDCCSDLVRSDFSEEEWIKKLWENLNNYGPVIYSGWAEGNSLGHTFVLDGYSSNGYFHINWGWSGFYDGYYLTGVGCGDYPARQRGVFGIRPDSGSLHIDDFEILEITRIDEPFKVRVDVYNPHGNAIDSEVVPILYSLSDKELVGYGKSKFIHMEGSQSLTSIIETFEFDNSIAVGSYWMSLGVREGDKIVDKCIYYRYIGLWERREQILQAKILGITDGENVGDIIVNYELTMERGRFDDAIGLIFIDDNGGGWYRWMNHIVCEEGETIQQSHVENISNFTSSPLEYGKTYSFNLYYNSKWLMEEPYQFTINNYNCVALKNVENYMAHTVDEPFEMSFAIENYANYSVDLEIYPEFYSRDDENTVIGYASSAFISVPASEIYESGMHKFEFVQTPQPGLGLMRLIVKRGENVIARSDQIYVIIHPRREWIMNADITKISNGATMGEIIVDYEVVMQRGRFDDALSLAMYIGDGGWNTLPMNPMVCEEGDTVRSSYVYQIPNATYGDTYTFRLWYNYEWYVDPAYEILIYDPATVEGVEVDEDGVIEYYDLHGRKVETSNMLPGLYIVRTISSRGTKTSKILIK